MFGQEVIQTLTVLSHLGILRLFFGGSNVQFSPVGAPPPSSITNEWSGLIGASLTYIQTSYWMTLAPIIFITLTVLSVSFMIEAMYKLGMEGHTSFEKEGKIVVLK
jgi:peptide/nickel transport system permease protein